jgi:hypothetical protein
VNSLPNEIPELDIRAVRERLDLILGAISLSRSVCTAAVELIEHGPSGSGPTHIRNMDVLYACEILIKRAEDMVEDLMNNPPTIDREAEATAKARRAAMLAASSNPQESTL